MDPIEALSEAIPGSQIYSTTPPAELVDGAKAFLLPAGSFVIMHSNMWHRGTKELCAPAPRISTSSQNPFPVLRRPSVLRTSSPAVLFCAQARHSADYAQGDLRPRRRARGAELEPPPDADLGRRAAAERALDTAHLVVACWRTDVDCTYC